jgi:hypothetical protein
MYCPERVVLDSKIVYITRHESCDYYGANKTPWKERLNPFRLEFIFLPFTNYRATLNKGGAAWMRISNAIFRLKCQFIKEKFYKISIGSHWMVGAKSTIDLEREINIANGVDPSEIKIEVVRMTRNQFNELPEFDGF